MRPSPRRLLLAALPGLALGGCVASEPPPAGPDYDPQIDEQITAAQMMANALVERLIGLDEELRALPPAGTAPERRLRAEAAAAATYRENRPAYEELRASLIGLQTRIAARGGQGTEELVEEVRRLRAILVGPGESLQAMHARAGRLPVASLEARQAEANAVFQSLLAREMALR